MKDLKGSDRLRRAAATDAVKVELVSAYAGDRDLTPGEQVDIEVRMRARGAAFFSDLLYAITHHYFAPEVAEALWREVLGHKRDLAKTLGRNVRVTVAALDYLSNVTDEMASPTLISETLVAEIVNVSMRDGMTGLYNHTSFYELLEIEVRNHRRHGSGVGLILLDIDDFKVVNDRFGHQEGDRVIVELAAALRQCVRESDICCRFGGEEFAVILPFTADFADALEVAERIRGRIAAIQCGPARVTVSAGVSLCDGESCSSRALVEAADRGLYRAKRDGKDRVVRAPLHA